MDHSTPQTAMRIVRPAARGGTGKVPHEQTYGGSYGFREIQFGLVGLLLGPGFWIRPGIMLGPGVGPFWDWFRIQFQIGFLDAFRD